MEFSLGVFFQDIGDLDGISVWDHAHCEEKVTAYSHGEGGEEHVIEVLGSFISIRIFKGERKVFTSPIMFTLPGLLAT